MSTNALHNVMLNMFQHLFIEETLKHVQGDWSFIDLHNNKSIT